MFDTNPFLEEDPWVQSYGQRREDKGKEEGKEEGHAERLRLCIKQMVQAHFPNLAKQAEERAEQLQSLDALQQIFVAMLAVPDERKAWRYLQKAQDGHLDEGDA